jgi:hypothetical protein
MAELLDRLHDIHHYLRQHLKTAKWKPATTAWPIPRDSKRVTKSACTARPGPEESHLSSSRAGKAHTRWSPGSTTWSAVSSDIQGRIDGCTLGKTGSTTRGYTGQAASGREQRHEYYPLKLRVVSPKTGVPPQTSGQAIGDDSTCARNAFASRDVPAILAGVPERNWTITKLVERRCDSC